MPEYFPDRRRLGKPLGRSPGLSGQYSAAINPRSASNRGGRKYNFSGSMNPAEYSMMMRKQKGDALANAYGMTPEQFDSHMRDKIAKATKFVSGGRKMGEKVTASAKNNIVGFTRGGGVRGSKGGLNALVKTISTNITSNVENIHNNVNNFARKRDTAGQKLLQPSAGKQVNNITKVVKPNVSNLNKTVNNVRNQSFNTIKGFRDSKKEGKDENTGLLGGMFGRFKDGLNLLKFLTNKKTQKDLSKSLQNLDLFFDDAYRVAFKLRKSLLKIFKALRQIRASSGSKISNLALGGGLAGLGGGIGLGALGRGRGRTTPNRKRRRRGRGRAGLLLGLAGGAAATGLATNALASETTPQIVAAKQTQTIPEGFTETFSSIVNTLTNALNNLFGKKQKPTPGRGSSSPGAGAAPGSTDNSSIPSMTGGGAGVGTPEQKALLDAVSFAEGTSKSYGTIFGGKVVPELERGELTIDEVHSMMMTEQVRGRNAGYAPGSVATGRYQFMPKTLRDIQRSMNLPGDTLFTNEMQDKMFLDRTAKYRGVTPELLEKEGLSDKVIDMMAPEIASFPNLMGDVMYGYGKSFYGQPVKSAESIRDAFNKSLLKGAPSAPVLPPPSIEPNLDQSSLKGIQSKSIATTAASQRQTTSPTIVSLPSMTPSAPPPQPMPEIDNTPAQRVATIPILPANDDDNYFALASKLTYGIVD